MQFANGGRKAKTIGRFGFEKFFQLAQNSFNVKKYSRAADNCRLAVDCAIQENNREGAANAYGLWIDSLFLMNRYSDLKKICCEARSKYGNALDLLYYEYRAAMLSGDMKIAAKFAHEFIEMAKSGSNQNNPFFNHTKNKLDEAIEMLSKYENDQAKNGSEVKLEN